MSTTKAQAEVWDEDEVNPVGDRWDTVEGLSEGAYINITYIMTALNTTISYLLMGL